VKRALALVIAGVALLGAGAPNWPATVRQTPLGSMVMGNPAAKVKLIEYVSYTCPHCAHYSGEASAPLKKTYIASGKVSVEFRNAVRDQFDLTAALAARCGGPAKFFGNSEAILAAQSVWMGKAQAYSAANAEKMKGMPMNAALPLLARALGFDAILKSRGVTPTQLNACLVNKAAQQQLVNMTNDAFTVRKIPGTPGFVINNVLVEDAFSWAALEPKLQAAVAAK
jgi:protein-disulfide isomerase